MTETPTATPPSPSQEPLLALIGLGQQARSAASLDELGFLLVNDSRLLADYRQALLWSQARGLSHVSGVLSPERNSPFVLWAQRVCALLASRPELAARELGAAELPQELGADWARWMPARAWWLPLDFGGQGPAGLLLADDTLDASRLPLWQEWCGVWSLAADRLCWRERRGWAGLWQRWQGPAAPGRPWWRRRRLVLPLVLVGVLLLPVPLTVVGQGELVPREPVLVRAPLDGVIHEFHVAPNQQVAAGAPLFSYDKGSIQSRLQLARQGLATAQAEYRQAAQSALSESRAKFQLAALVGRVQEKQAELDYLGEQAGRSTVNAPQAGMVLFDNVAEWIGKPVQTGERVLRMAEPTDVELEVWLGVADAVPLRIGDPLRLFLAANPLHTVSARLRWMGYEAQARPDGSYAYRLRASLDGPAAGEAAAPGQQVGAKGTVRLTAGHVPLAYWLLRKPLAVLRGYLLI